MSDTLFKSSYYEQYFTEDCVERALEEYESFCTRDNLPFEIGDDVEHALEALKMERDAGEDAMLNTVMYHAIEIMGMENPNDDDDD